MSFRTDWPSTFAFAYGRPRPYAIPLDPNHHHEVMNYLAQSKSSLSDPEHLPLFIGSTHRGGAVHWFMGFPAFSRNTGQRCGQHVFDMVQAPAPNGDHWIIRERGTDGASAGPPLATTYTSRLMINVLLLDRATRQRCIQGFLLNHSVTVGQGQEWDQVSCISYVWKTLLCLI